jgi:hypothetical protein
VPPSLQSLPASLSIKEAVSIVIEEGIPIFRASQIIQHRIETLLQKQAEETLTPEEIVEFDRYKKIDEKSIQFLRTAQEAESSYLTSVRDRHSDQIPW